MNEIKDTVSKFHKTKQVCTMEKGETQFTFSGVVFIDANNNVLVNLASNVGNVADDSIKECHIKIKCIEPRISYLIDLTNFSSGIRTSMTSYIKNEENGFWYRPDSNNIEPFIKVQVLE